jgi:OOP family OmpA-OmpF porin
VEKQETMKQPLLALLSGAAALAAIPAMAQVSWYAAASGGQARTDGEYIASVENGLGNVQTAHTSMDKDDAAWKVTGGLRLGRGVALEVTYVDLGKISTSTRGTGGNFMTPYGVDINRKVQGVGVDVVGSLPVASRLDLLGKLGVYRMNVKTGISLVDDISFTGSPAERSRNVDGKEDIVHVGLGLHYRLAPRWAIRAEYERFMDVGNRFVLGDPNGTGRADVDVASAGVVFSF